MRKLTIIALTLAVFGCNGSNPAKPGASEDRSTKLEKVTDASGGGSNPQVMDKVAPPANIAVGVLTTDTTPRSQFPSALARSTPLPSNSNSFSSAFPVPSRNHGGFPETRTSPSTSSNSGIIATSGSAIAAALPATQTEVLDITIPDGVANAPVSVPAVLASPDPAVAPATQQVIDTLAQDFADQISAPETTAQNYGSVWSSAQKQSDDRFRTIFGKDAFLAYNLKAGIEAQGTTGAK